MSVPTVNAIIRGGCPTPPQTYKTVVLKPCWVNNRNILLQEMMNDASTKYVIKWDFDLDGKTITVPEKCVLEFDGGSLKNGTIIGQDTFVNNVGGVADIFGLSIDKQGTWRDIDIDIDDALSSTSVNPVQNKVVKAAIDNIQGGVDKEYNPAEFSGLGKVYLKKNIVEAGGVEKNILTQDAFYKDGTQTPNTDTVFVVQYDFDLNGETINVPARCVLEFDSGSVSNGIINSNGTILTGLFESSSEYLYGAFYTNEGELLNHNKKVATTLYLTTEFGEEFNNYNEEFNDIISTSQGYVGISALQGIAVTSEHVFLFFITDSYNVEGSYPYVFCYDRYYNMLGYCQLRNYSHLNDATVADGIIYIPDFNHGKVNYISEENLYAACLSHTPITLSEISCPYISGQLDYDEYSQTFACLSSNTNRIRILDRQFNVLKEGTIDIVADITNHLQQRVTFQGCVYSKGLLYLDVGVDDQQIATLAICDVNSDTVVKYIRIPVSAQYVEGEGMCIDPSTGKIIIALNAWSTNYTHFEIATLEFRDEEYVFKDDLSSGAGYTDIAHNVQLYVNNNVQNKNYIPTGTSEKPYRSITEALICRKSVGRYVQINLVNTGKNYYFVNNTITPTAPLRIFGQGGKPTIVGFFEVFNQAFLHIQNVVISSPSRFTSSALIGVSAANCYVSCEYVDFNLKPNTVAIENKGDSPNTSYALINTCTFIGNDTTVNPEYPSFECNNIAIKWGPFGNIMFTGANTFRYCIGILTSTNHVPHIEAITSTTYLNMVFQNAAFIKCTSTAVYGNIYIGDAFSEERYQAYKNFLQYCSTDTCSIKLPFSRRLTTGEVMEPGIYIGTNLDFRPIGNIIFKNISNGVNLIKESSNLVIRNSADLDDIWESWRIVNSEGGSLLPVPTIVDANFNLIEGVNKAFRFYNEGSDILTAYNFSFIENNVYCFSFWAKGHGTVIVSMPYSEFTNVFYKTIDSETYEYHFVRILIPESDVKAIYLQSNAGDVYVCAPKLELGDRPTLWKPDSQNGLNTQRPAHPNIGEVFFDKSIGTNGTPIWYAGNNVWVDSSGNVVQ